MLRKEMTRKEFLTFVTAAFGLVLLSRLPLGGTARPRVVHGPGSYGNNTYGSSGK